MSAATELARLVDAKALSEHVRHLRFASDAPIDFSPGQWLSLSLPVGEHPPLVRAYSLADAPSPGQTPDNAFTLCFDRVDGGLGSGYLWNLAPGATISFTGPHGNFVLPDGDGPLVFAARYTGIVPFRAMLQALERGATPRSVTLIYGASGEPERVFGDELQSLADRADWLDYRPVADGDEAGALSSFPENAIALVCGVRTFTKPLRENWMERFGVERRAIRLENFSG